MKLYEVKYTGKYPKGTIGWLVQNFFEHAPNVTVDYGEAYRVRKGFKVSIAGERIEELEMFDDGSVTFPGEETMEYVGSDHMYTNEDGYDEPAVRLDEPMGHHISVEQTKEIR